MSVMLMSIFNQCI